jgi:hypothetical protein
MNAGLLTLALTIGQPVVVPERPTLRVASPFLFVTVDAGPGTKVTWHPTGTEETTTAGPVGLRPGYPYRFRVSDIPGTRGATLYPSIEVRGSLVPRHGLPDVSKHPVPILLTDHDITRVLDGRLVTKVYYLEDPEKALGVAGTAGEAIEANTDSEEAAIAEARVRGRPMLILRVGERPFSQEELAIENVPGTIVFPGAKSVPIPAAGPRFPFAGVMVYDPILGPKGTEEECLMDGGDVGARVGPDRVGGIGGLDPSDTAMKFTTRHGTKVAPSNRVCICVPRFAAARVETGPAGHHVIAAPERHHLVQPVAALVSRIGPGEARSLDQMRGFTGSMRASMFEARTGPEAIDLWSGRPAGFTSLSGALAVAQFVGPDEVTTFRNAIPLLEKRFDPPHPDRIGQEVTVHLRFSNPTTQTMTDVVIADSLTTRLEYIEGTARTSRPATFTATSNGAGSVKLQWAIDGPLKPGESGTISFKVRIK